MKTNPTETPAMRPFYSYRGTWQDLDNYPDGDGEGWGGFRALLVYPESSAGPVVLDYSTHKHVPLGGDWLPMLNDDSLDAAGLSEQMLTMAFAKYPETPDATRVEYQRSLVEWINEYRDSRPPLSEWG
jgi:hypothetical protein